MKLLASLLLLLASSAAAQITPCAFARIDPTCGPVFTGDDRIKNTNGVRAHVLTFKATGAPRNAIGVFTFGTTPLNVPFPGTTCVLHVLPRILVPFNTNATGSAQVSVGAPAGLNLTLFLQTGFDDAGALVLSNGLRMSCTD